MLRAQNSRMSEFMSTHFNYLFYPLRSFISTPEGLQLSLGWNDIHLFQGGKADIGRTCCEPTLCYVLGYDGLSRATTILVHRVQGEEAEM